MCRTRNLLKRPRPAFCPCALQTAGAPFDVYARPWSGKRGAKVAVIIGGLGISQTSTQRAIRTLPPEITLAFAPQGNSLSRWAQEASRGGHEILLQIPMEPFDYPRVNPGRGTLLTENEPTKNVEELRRSLGRFTNYSGVVNYMGARLRQRRRFSADHPRDQPNAACCLSMTAHLRAARR